MNKSNINFSCFKLLTDTLTVTSKSMLLLLLLSTLISCGGGSASKEKETINLDHDNDGVFDQVDTCPNTPENTNVDANGCEIIISVDSDNDGVFDQVDTCPNTPENTNVDANGCEIIISVDSDNDGINDDNDSCPNTPNNTKVDESGCEVIYEPVEILIQAEDYTNYLDITPANDGGAAYRNDQVDIEVTTDEGGGYNIGYTEATEWLEYSVTLNEGTYALSTRVASESGGGKYSLSINGSSVGSDTVTSTGGWQSFETHNVGSFAISSGTHTLRLDVNSGPFNINWLQIVSVTDDDKDGIANELDACLNTPNSSIVNDLGCPDSDNDGIFDNLDNCPATPEGAYVDFFGCETVKPLIEVAFDNDMLVGGADSDKPGFTLYIFDNDNGADGSNCNDDCATHWPPLLVTDGSASGVPNLSTVTRNDGTIQAAYDNKPLYFFSGDSSTETTEGTKITGWHIQTYGLFGDIVPLYTSSTEQEHALIYETSDAVVTKFADRGRDRHAKEDQFQQYDHYLSHYWTHRTARYKFTDYVAKGGSSILVEWVSEWQLEALEFRAWYSGMNTVAQYHGNYEPNVITVGHGTYDDDLVQTSSTGDQYKYSLSINEFRGINGSNEPLNIGQHMEIEVSQFLLGVPEGRANYYGTTYLYQVGKGGMVPWKTVGDFDDKASERENSHPIAKKGWLGGNTTLPYQYTNEPNDHFMQMATNLSSLNGQAFVLGRRIHHTSFIDGKHDEDPANGIFAEMIGQSGTHFVNNSCASCHERNGRAAPAPEGEALDKWVFKIADANGEPDTNRGRVLQPSNTGGVQAEGTVSIASWTEANGLRSPNYHFSSGTPEKFSARIAPQLVGLGLLEAIPEEAILALADVNDEMAPFGISGKAQSAIDPLTKDIRLGRFGWKAATSSVKHQIAGALNTDMGVMTSLLTSPDCGSAQLQRGECGNDQQELGDEHLNNLTKYIALLGVRAQRGLDDAQVQLGQALFTSTGCTDCHTPTFQTSIYHPLSELRDQTIHPYTDMLLHDMGEGLADNLGEGNATGAEWRTTPLWGIGLSACVTGGVVNPIGGQGNEVCTPVHSYLHDGRARTIDEAILWHGGESEISKTKYEALSESDEAALLSFLESL
ncbi:di-heme oxidoredictase family protein [Candidatus Colwellia aromaticivorans]|uniref:di-heme oxidoredictase family protein n=1 Tax=Candidatus Colwellia aromaticivorans TaxID=2267621 RepID=UPI000DF3E823|nr:di-heme oxidoredictase family protein [Candidatus Colwellia aromaticivorans]